MNKRTLKQKENGHDRTAKYRHHHTKSTRLNLLQIQEKDAFQIKTSISKSKDKQLKKIKHLQSNQCPICLQPINNQCKLQCNHLFCLSCVQQWFKNSSNCPNCRANVQRYQHNGDFYKVQQKQFVYQDEDEDEDDNQDDDYDDYDYEEEEDEDEVEEFENENQGEDQNQQDNSYDFEKQQSQNCDQSYHPEEQYNICFNCKVTESHQTFNHPLYIKYPNKYWYCKKCRNKNSQKTQCYLCAQQTEQQHVFVICNKCETACHLYCDPNLQGQQPKRQWLCHVCR